MIDIRNLPLPPADFKPTLPDWKRYQESIRHLVEGMIQAGLSRVERETRPYGLHEDLDLDQEVRFDTFKDKLRVAQELAWAKELHEMKEHQAAATPIATPVEPEIVPLRGSEEPAEEP